MDAERFDDLTRLLAGGVSRRRVLGLLGGAFAGLIAGPVAAVADLKRGGARCRQNGECASGVCLTGGANGRGRCQGVQGDTCRDAAACATGFCVDGVCCDRACTEQCESCRAPGAPKGVCAPVTGRPRGGRPVCGGTGRCGGSCDGVSPVCVFPGAEKECGRARCADATLTAAATCDGAGSCAPPVVTACAPFRCASRQACATSCGSDGECAAGGYCDESGVCRTDFALGETCGRGEQCASGFCADGVCCDGPCDGQCESCAGGTCLPVVGQPVNGRPACPSDGSICGGACDGSSPDCVVPAAGTECLPGMCAGPTLTTASLCDGAGACVAGQTTDCSPYFCSDGACLETCGDCVSGPCVDGVCCAEDDFCEGHCCSPDRESTEVCCPGTGQCCECFVREEHGGSGGVECCLPDKVCASLTNSPADDTCCRRDESCVEGRCVWNARVCEDRECPNRCCNGECCGPWETCGAGGCEPLPTCTVDNEETACAGGGVCASINDGTESRVCCPSNRVIDFTESGAPPGTYECCPFGQEPPQSDSTSCCFGPDYCRTSRGTFGRF